VFFFGALALKKLDCMFVLLMRVIYAHRLRWDCK
jgi:hypothetical protein